MTPMSIEGRDCVQAAYKVVMYLFTWRVALSAPACDTNAVSSIVALNVAS